MSKNKAQLQPSFKLNEIELMEFSLHGNEVDPQQSSFTYNTQLNLEHKINAQNKIIIVLVYVKVSNVDSNASLATIKAELIFEFDSFESFITDDPQKFNFPDEVLLNINSISVSTLRGIMFTLFRGTSMHKVLLPLIDPRTFVVEQENT